MNNLAIFPIVLPLLAGIFMFFLRKSVRAQKLLAVFGLLGTIGISAYLVHWISQDGIVALHVGGWTAPYGITIVADMLSALLATTTSVVGLACMLYAFHTINKERENNYFYPLMMILVSGVNGSFLTGDIFNLFVFFEVMLLASYVLLSLGGEKPQMRETIKYLVINVVASSLFVVAIAYLYSITGTLNMAHLSARVAEAGQDGLLTTVSLIFLVVFGLKAGLFLFFWLPGSYSSPPPAIAAIFAALLTKVGIYAIVRVFTLIFYHQPQITHTVIMWMAALTMLLGAIGAVAYWDIRRILAYNVIISVGFIMLGLAIATEGSLAGTLYYLIHDMVAKGYIYMLGGAVIIIAGTDKLRDISGLIRYRPILGWLFLLGVLALAGVPPLSGFVGKVMILQAAVADGLSWMAVIGLISSLLVLYSTMKIFINSFWGEKLLSEGEQQASGRGTLLPLYMLAALIIGLGVGAEWVMGYLDQAAEVMSNPAIYINAVLGDN